MFQYSRRETINLSTSGRYDVESRVAKYKKRKHNIAVKNFLSSYYQALQTRVISDIDEKLVVSQFYNKNDWDYTDDAYTDAQFYDF